jgi:hypothetical protein
VGREYGIPVVMNTFEGTKVLKEGMRVRVDGNMGTVTIFERVPGQVYGEGQGIFMSATGEGAIWNGTSVAHMTGEGMAASVRFSIAFQAPATGPLARLNGVLGIGEQEIGADGSVHTTIWEWK